MRHFKIEFDEVTIPLAQENSRAELLRYSPSGKCPALKDDNIIVWNSLATIEYLADNEPRTAIWQRPRAARAKARALCKPTGSVAHEHASQSYASSVLR